MCELDTPSYLFKKEASILFDDGNTKDTLPGHISDYSEWSRFLSKNPIDHLKKDFVIESKFKMLPKWFDLDSYTLVDTIEEEDIKVLRLIINFQKTNDININFEIYNRLMTLYYDAKEEDSTNPGIRFESLRNFYFFILLNVNLKLPAISLTPDNNIYISWRGDNNQVFSIHFLPNNLVRFVLFMKNRKHPDKKIRISGQATNDTIFESIIHRNDIYWINLE